VSLGNFQSRAFGALGFYYETLPLLIMESLTTLVWKTVPDWPDEPLTSLLWKTTADWPDRKPTPMLTHVSQKKIQQFCMSYLCWYKLGEKNAEEQQEQQERSKRQFV